MKRRFAAISARPLSTKGSAADSIVVDAIGVGSSRVVLAVYDDAANGALEVQLMSFDLAATAPLPEWNFSTRSAQSSSVTAWALRAPTLETVYDADSDRLIAALPMVMGPSGNSLAVIRPDNGVVERIIPLLGEPNHLSVSAHGSIAYVSVRSMLAVQKIDLRTGTILGTLENINATALAVKSDDPNTVAIMTTTDQGEYQLRSYTNLLAAPLMITARDGMSLDYALLLGSNAPNELIAIELLSSRTLWRLSWTSSGLAIASHSGSFIGGDTPKMKFGRLSSSVTVVSVADAANTARYAIFDSLQGFALISAGSGVGLVNDSANYSPALQWLQEPSQPHPDGRWDKAKYLVIVDKAFPSDSSYVERYDVDTGAPGQVMMRANGIGSFMGGFNSFAGYIYSIKPK
jgi:hypothetical protein